MGFFYLILSIVALCMQLITAAWWMKCFPVIGWKGPLIVSVLGTLLLLVGLPYTHTHQTGFLSGVLYYLAYIWFGIVFLSFCFSVGFALLGKILAGCHLPAAWLGPVSLLTLVVVVAMAFLGGFSTPKIKRVFVQIPGAAPMKLAVLSDTHLGMGVSLARLDNVLQKMQSEQPDALLVLGDVFEYGPDKEAYAARLKQVQTPLGSYGVFGNHEYYVGYGASKDFFQQAGIYLLENTARMMPNGVEIVGLKDIETAQVSEQEVAALLKQRDPDVPRILLSHTPLYPQTAAAHGVDLMLSGHTHNGQLWPFNYLVKMKFPYIYGLYTIGRMPFYVTSGVFYWGIPLRFLAPAEIVIIEVNAA